MLNELWLAVLGITAGLVSGCFGMGGGIILVPGFDYFFRGLGIQPSLTFAVATSLSVVAIINLMSAWYHARHADMTVNFHPNYWMVTIIIGMSVSILLVPYMPIIGIRLLFSMVLFLHGWQTFFGAPVTSGSVQVKKSTVLVRGLMIGFCTSVLGIGGSLLLMPYLLGIGVSTHTAIGFCTRLTTLITGLSSVLYMAWGIQQGMLFDYTLGYVYWPAILLVALPGIFGAWLGAKISSLIPVLWHRRLFAIILVAVAFSMLYQCFGEYTCG